MSCASNTWAQKQRGKGVRWAQFGTLGGARQRWGALPPLLAHSAITHTGVCPRWNQMARGSFGAEAPRRRAPKLPAPALQCAVPSLSHVGVLSRNQASSLAWADKQKLSQYCDEKMYLPSHPTSRDAVKMEEGSAEEALPLLGQPQQSMPPGVMSTPGQLFAHAHAALTAQPADQPLQNVCNSMHIVAHEHQQAQERQIDACVHAPGVSAQNGTGVAFRDHETPIKHERVDVTAESPSGANNYSISSPCGSCHQGTSIVTGAVDGTPRLKLKLQASHPALAQLIERCGFNAQLQLTFKPGGKSMGRYCVAACVCCTLPAFSAHGRAMARRSAPKLPNTTRAPSC